VQLTKKKNDQQDAGEPVFSPDGKYLYWSEDMSGGSTFEYNKDPNGTIYHVRRLNVATGEIVELIDRPGGAVRPQPSPTASASRSSTARGTSRCWRSSTSRRTPSAICSTG
jgi:hypothetical protein